MTNHEQLQTALKLVWSELPAMLGDRMNAFETTLLTLLRRLDRAPLDALSVDAVLTMLERDYPKVYERMVEAMAERTVDVAFRSTSGAVRSNVGRYVVVPVWYATDREDTGSNDPGARYSGNRGALHFGRVEVSIPDSHKHEKGKLEKPRWFRLEFREDPEKHVLMVTLEPSDATAWKGEVKQKLAGCSKRDLLLFIHGYNVDFETAALRAAQFAHDMEFQGLALLYSWPSEGAVLKYMVDEDNAQWSVDDFEVVLNTLMTELGAECVHAVAHSMGNRVLAEGIRRMDVAALPSDAARLREVIFAAPDINADTFRKFAEKFSNRASRFTLYVSNADIALSASQKAHKYPRAGDSGDGVVLSEGLETIDASAVDKNFLGHSYFCDNRVVLQDMFNLIMEGQSAAKPRFGLKEQITPEGRYWAMQP